MPLFEYECKKCGLKIELLVKNEQSQPTCKSCGEKLTRVYSGKMYGSTGKVSGGCTGNCATCSGCKK